MSQKHIVEDIRPLEPTIQEDLAALGDDDVMDLVNLTSEDTGVDGIVMVTTAMGQHGPRVKYYVKTGKGQPSFSVSIAKKPKVLTSSLPERAVNRVSPDVIAWVALNSDALLSFWKEGQFWMRREVEEFFDGLKKLPKR